MKIKKPDIPLWTVIKYIAVLSLAVGLLKYPTDIAQGIRNGLMLLGENIIPSLFPFMVLSGYIGLSPVTDFAAKHLNKLTYALFAINAYGFFAFILGCVGGYPIGAKTTAEFYKENKLSQKEAQRVMLWSVNPGPAFAITAVGTFMAGNTKAGIIMYASCILTSLSIGLFHGILCRFANYEKAEVNTQPVMRKHIFIKAVSDGSRSMLSVCGWVLIFCGCAALINATISNRHIVTIINCLAEVTLGCKSGIENRLSLPLICAILGFSGFAVIAQVSPYLEQIGLSVKTFVCWRIVNAASSAFYCSRLLRLFPQSTAVFNPSTAQTDIAFAHSIPAAVILVLMCFVLVLEVDNRRKVC